MIENSDETLTPDEFRIAQSIQAPLVAPVGFENDRIAFQSLNVSRPFNAHPRRDRRNLDAEQATQPRRGCEREVSGERLSCNA